MRTVIGVVILMALVAVRSSSAEPRVEKNIVYGMFSGSALLLDIHRPEKPNGYGVIHVGGSGWHASLAYDALPLKESQIGIWGPPLLRAGYTVFSINHRAAPAFRYPAAVEDVQRAVRFIRHNARLLGVEPTRLGGMGGSSGGHLLGLVAMLRAPGIADDPDPVNREPATLETVVLRAGKFDMARRPVPGATASFMGLIPNNAVAQKVYAAASPITHVSAGAPPVLLLHGDSDDVVPFEESVEMEKALRAANVAVKLVRIPGGEHGEDFGAQGKPNPSWPDYYGEMVAWFDQHLKTTATGVATAPPTAGRD